MDADIASGGAAFAASSSLGPAYRSTIDRICDVLTRIQKEIAYEHLEDLVVYLLGSSSEENMEMFRAKPANDVFNILINGHNLKQIIVKLNDAVPKIIKDVPEMTDELQALTSQFTRELHELGLDSDSEIYGRDTELSELITLVTEQCSSVYLINICGMAGIGKTHLVRHLGARLVHDGYNSLINVNARGINDVGVLIPSILKKAGCVCNGSKDHLTASMIEWFVSKIQRNHILILDDVSTLMSSPSTAVELLSLLNHLIKEVVRRKAKLRNRYLRFKIVLTSHTELLIKYERNKPSALLDIKKNMADYTCDIRLMPLNDSAAKQFLHSSSLLTKGVGTTKHVETILKRCGGHPLSLSLLRFSSSDSSTTTESETTEITVADVDELARGLFEKSFVGLLPHQKNLLILLSVFQNGISVDVLYNVLSPKEQSLAEFTAQLMKEFSSGFWINISTMNDIRVESSSKTHITTHHPLVQSFLRQQAKSAKYREQASNYERRVALYFLKQMQEIGKLCLEMHSASIELLSHNTGNFVLALQFINKHQMTIEVISSQQQSLDASPLPIMNLFICVHYFYDSFQGSLYKCLTDLVNCRGESNPTRSIVLLKLLYALVLSLEKDWKVLYDTLGLFPEEQLHKLATTPDLYMFCKGLYKYIKALLHTYASCHKGNFHEDFTKEREKLYETANNLIFEKLQGPKYQKIVAYFSIHIQLDLADAIWCERNDIAIIKRASKTCAKTMKHLKTVPTLKDLIHVKTGIYRALEADQIDDVTVAGKLYAEAAYHHESAMKGYKDRGMEMCYMASHNHLGYANMLRSWGMLLMLFGEKKDLKVAEAMMLKSIAEGTTRVKMMSHSVTFSQNRSLYYHGLVQQGDAYSYVWNLAKQINSSSSVKEKYLLGAKIYYSWAYDLLKNDPHSCHLQESDPSIERLIQRLPQLLALDGEDQKSIDKVKHDFSTIKENAKREALFATSSSVWFNPLRKLGFKF